MKIKKIDIKNYRNFENISLTLNPELTFIIGENNLGKSNLLDLLDTIFNKRSFYEDDFKDVNKEIEIKLKLGLKDVEIGIFDDLVSIENSNSNNDYVDINLIVKQESSDDNIKIYHYESGEEIFQKKLRVANLIKYDPLRRPSDELDFSKGKGAGKFLGYFVEKHYDDLKNSLINTENLANLINLMNNNLETFNNFSGLHVKIGYKYEAIDQILSLLELIDENGVTIFKAGYGVQFNLIIYLYILQKITEIFKLKQNDDYIFSDLNGNKYISLILCIDEPEIHMHPCMQRNLIKTIYKLITNQDENFKRFIRNIFGIDIIIGQGIIVTHSPNILLNDYRQYLRLFIFNENHIKAISGSEIDLDDRAKKHLYKQIQYIKEAFFSRVAIIVEGDTENGAFPEWIEKSGIDMDKNGIIIIKADGKDSIPYLKELLEKFGIKSYTFADRDDNQNNNFDFMTIGRNLEEDVVDGLFNFSEEDEDKKRNVVYDILSEIFPAEFTEEQREYRIKNLDKNKTLKTLKDFKSISTGKIIGQRIPLEYIPLSVQDLINKIKHDLLAEDER